MAVLDHAQESLCDAARSGSSAAFVAALAASADPSALTVGGESPVVACASVGRLDLLNKLLSAGASADASSSSPADGAAAASGAAASSSSGKPEEEKPKSGVIAAPDDAPNKLEKRAFVEVKRI